MRRDGAYGQVLADAMGVRRASTFVSNSTLRASKIAVTEIRSFQNEIHETQPMAPENGILAMVQMAPWPKRVLREDGREKPALPLAEGTATVFDLRKVWTGVRFTPVHYLCFYFPSEALKEVAGLEDVALPEDYPNDYCAGNDDSVLDGLARSLLPSFSDPASSNQLFVEHITLAACAHLLRRYGKVKDKRSLGKVLSRSELRKSLEFMNDGNAGDVTIPGLAAQCGMTPSEYAEAFLLRTGQRPDQWLELRRLEIARRLMARDDMSLQEIATNVGFRSLAQFERSFFKEHGMTSVRFRRLIWHGDG